MLVFFCVSSEATVGALYPKEHWKATRKSLSLVRYLSCDFWTFPNIVEWSLTPVNNPGRKTPAVPSGGCRHYSEHQTGLTYSSFHACSGSISSCKWTSFHRHYGATRDLRLSRVQRGFSGSCASGLKLPAAEAFQRCWTLHHHRLQPETWKPVATAQLNFWNTNSAKTTWPSMLYTHDSFFFSMFAQGKFYFSWPPFNALHQNILIFWFW